MKLRVIKTFITSLALGLVTFSAQANPLQDEWENPVEKFNQNQICQSVPKIWTLPISADKRAEAIKKLDTQFAIELSDAEFSYWSSVPIDGEGSAAWQILAMARDKLKKDPDKRRNDFCDNKSGAECLYELKSLSGSGASKPFLIRAIAKNEFTGVLGAAECEDGIHISHFSLGRSTPPTIKMPTIVFLTRPPHDVFTSWYMAE